jgi:hypothetical protein
MIQFAMQPDMVYRYPLWEVGLMSVGLAALGAVVLVLIAGRLLSVDFRCRHNDRWSGSSGLRRPTVAP